MRLNQSDSESTAGPIPLDRLPVDTPAVVSFMQADGEDIVRMQSMGVCEGRPIHTVRAGSRMVVCAAGTRIGLHQSVAASVMVTPLPEGTPPCAGA